MKKTNQRIPVTVYNTLGRTQQPLKDKENILLYVCGVTPYDHAHLGHGRCYVTFDLLYRLLTFLGYNVTYTRNFTDIDDKLINRADKELNDPTQYLMLANKYIESFHQDMKALNCKSPDYEPRVTQVIPQIISFVEGLIAKGKAYATPVGDVYYDISSFKDYGKLSQRSLDDLQAGARVTVRSDKKNPLDFALWKSTDTQPGWESPWGLGRPGWHIECSAMAKEYLGDTIDIHGGGMDLIFPHHENEIAQSEGLTNKPFVLHWMHNAFVRVNQEKMSKSLGNFLTLKDAYTTFNPMLLRYYYLIHHYRSPLDFSPEDIKATGKSYQRLCQAFEGIEPASPTEILASGDTLTKDLIQALTDDLNVAKFMGLIFDHLKDSGPNQKALIKGLFTEVLGLDLVPEVKPEVTITTEIQELLDQREQARNDRDWSKADELRDKLKDLGFDVQDKKA